MASKKKMKWSGLLLLLLAALVYFYRTLPENFSEHDPSQTTLNRNPKELRLSKHARCRMDCRHIDESEVRQLLADGSINHHKSDLDHPDVCQKRYALEGRSHDDQQVRMIVASCGTTTTVITVIDLGEEWTCACD